MLFRFQFYVIHQTMSEITVAEAEAIVPTSFLEANVASRNKLKQGLKKEQDKQAALREQFGDKAEALFQEWRQEQETSQAAQEAKLQDVQETTADTKEAEIKEEV